MPIASLVQLSRTVTADTAAATGNGRSTFEDPVETDTEAPEDTNPQFSTAATLEYYLVRDNLIATVWGGELRGQSSIVSDFINSWVDRRLEDGTFTGYPTADQLLSDQAFVNGAWATRFRAAGAPTNFVYTDENGGRFLVSTLGEPKIVPLAPGTTGFNPYTGTEFEDLTFDQTSTGEAGQRPERPETTPIMVGDDEKLAGAKGGKESRLAKSPSTPALSENPELIKPSISGSSLPTLDTGDLRGLLSAGSSGGGGGGGGRAAQEFDLNQLKEATRAVYRRWYRVDPDDRTLDKVAQSYAREANAFWIGKGGRLDFDTYMREKLREDPRYQRMFQFRPPSVDEDRFIAEFEAPIAGLGLRSSTTEAEIRNAAMSGGSASSQALRVSRSREASTQAGYARRLGSTVQSLGRLG